jgi:hypothetical protein
MYKYLDKNVKLAEMKDKNEDDLDDLDWESDTE